MQLHRAANIFLPILIIVLNYSYRFIGNQLHILIVSLISMFVVVNIAFFTMKRVNKLIHILVLVLAINPVYVLHNFLNTAILFDIFTIFLTMVLVLSPSVYIELPSDLFIPVAIIAGVAVGIYSGLPNPLRYSLLGILDILLGQTVAESSSILAVFMRVLIALSLYTSLPYNFGTYIILYNTVLFILKIALVKWRKLITGLDIVAKPIVYGVVVWI
ncbi:MAG: hypothetical protein QW836_09905 [Ignisphaera sp.]